MRATSSPDNCRFKLALEMERIATFGLLCFCGHFEMQNDDVFRVGTARVTHGDAGDSLGCTTLNPEHSTILPR